MSREREEREGEEREGEERESKVCAEFLYALKYMQTDRQTERQTDDTQEHN